MYCLGNYVSHTHLLLLAAEVAPCRPPVSLVQSQGIRYWFPASRTGRRARPGAPAGGAAQVTHTSQTGAGRERANMKTPAASHHPTHTDTLPRSKERNKELWTFAIFKKYYMLVYDIKQLDFTLPTKSAMLNKAMVRIGSHSPSVSLRNSDSKPGNRHSVMKYVTKIESI